MIVYQENIMNSLFMAAAKMDNFFFLCETNLVPLEER